MSTTTKQVLWGNISLMYSDTHQLLLCNDQIIPLTPTEYRLCRLFLNTTHQNIIFQPPTLIFPYISKTQLQTQAYLPNKQLLRKHICNLNNKLAPHDLSVRSFELGYVFVNKKVFLTY